ncbi:hypothetical protein BDZ45DRAFT_738535 [Acephala macrosclerotiorum]|nr:hypothetical protein BDZ45DRAFT_738535 [Acephala macrosclerotiorum]
MRRNVLGVEQQSESTTATSRSVKTLDPDLSSYFFIRRQTNESAAVSPSYQEFKDNASKSPTAKPQRSQLTQNTDKSAGSNKSTKSKKARTRVNSINSVLSASSKYRNIAEWNDKSVGASTELWTPSSFESQLHPADPPRPPRPGLEWVWFPEGYWAEREVRDVPPKTTRQRWWNRSPDRSPEKSKRDSAASKLTSTDNVPRRTDIPEIKIGSTVSFARTVSVGGGKSRKSSRQSSKVESLLSIKLGRFKFLRPVAEADISSNHPEEALGLCCRTKKSIKKRLHTLAPKTPKPSRVESGMNSLDLVGWGSRTTTVLEGAARYFNNQQRLGTKSYASTPALPSSPEYRPRRPFGLAPWHRKSSNDSFLSVSSSVHQILMGRTPAASPYPEFRYAGHEGRTYPKVDISSPDPSEPNFLPSEATRINTPPMSSGTPAIGARGFFFDLGKAGNEADTASPVTSAGSGSAIGKPKSSPKASSPKASPREWWEADSKHATTGNKLSHPIEKHATRAFTPSAFELSLPPEHLPSSPLCPKNPMHSSGGNGVCPFHGRRKSAGLKVIRRVNAGDTSDGGTTGSTVTPYR